MRLIDADRLYLEMERFYNGHKGELRKVASNALDLVCMMPTVDAVPVVRCCDCEYWEIGYKFCKICGLTAYGSSIFGEKSFCSFGERKGEGE